MGKNSKQSRGSIPRRPKVATGAFAARCYELLKQVPRGRVTTYAEIARALGTKAYRAVGQAMNKNQNAPVIPCHRVVGANGKLTGYALGLDKKRKILANEGIATTPSTVKDFDKKFWPLQAIA